ncbi:aminopeptidase N [Brevibacterium sp. 5221]|uniref:Aminopeptidase N n=1 Tax=Brevibacterium rongguiense TaxID=2695267 RepID=A0A6N9H6X1_9MICO|nr:aminopeptidase N [Brevibacterium rongguiense]MYM19506.1 aminopeptidase N [Brevibacterium rongguiense]
MTTNLTRSEARTRSDLLTVDRYEVDLDISGAEDPQERTFRSTSTVVFEAAAAAPTFIDIIADSVSAIDVNGGALDPERAFDGARVRFESQAGRNTVTITARCAYSRSGEGMHRFFDPADDRVYLYTQYEPTDARRVFANFDQPDLKANFQFTVTAPESFVVLTNTEPAEQATTDSGAVERRFAATKRQSSYITCVCAGHYAQAHDEYVDEHTGQRIPLGMYARQSLAEHMESESVFAITKQGLDFFHASFDFPYPWGKYDQIFVPEYNLGAMENPGLVTFSDTYLHRDAVTRSEYEQRAEVILHEMTHMWFGDLVTMKWWDDLWLKESFADYMATLALTNATEFSDGWTTFALRRKDWAYRQDQYPTTHPIVADIPDVEAARLNFDGITYAKGAAVLKQLVAFVGLEAFLEGARAYFRAHAYSATTLEDFLTALEAAAPGRDVHSWAAAWLQTTGMSELSLSVEAAEGRVASATLRQRNSDAGAEGPGTVRPHAVRLAAFERHSGGDRRGSSRLVPAGSWALELRAPEERIDVLDGATSPDLLLLNYGDDDYAKVRLDERSTRTALRSVTRLGDPMDRAVVWSALNNAMRDGLLPVRDWLGAYCRSLGREEHAGIAVTLRNQMLTALDRWTAAREHDAALSDVLGAALDALSTASPHTDNQLDLVETVLALVRRTAASEYVTPAVTAARAWATNLLQVPAGETFDDEVIDLTVDRALRWKALIALVALGWADYDDIEAEATADRTGTGGLRARTARAARPLPIVKMRAWTAATADETLSNDAISATIAGFTTPAGLPLTEPYVETYFDELAGYWTGRSMEIAKRIIVGLYPSWSLRGDRVLELTDAWLSEHADAPAAQRRLLLEQRDELARSLRLRAAGERSHRH